MTTLVENHFRETESLLRDISADEVSSWLLNQAYFPEQYVLPPIFNVEEFTLGGSMFNNMVSPTRRKLTNISYPKTLLTSRVFGIQHPWHYHDIVYLLNRNWRFILDHLFHEEIKIFSYSLPIPVSKRKKKGLSPLRSGRMIYEWISMSEKDLVLDSDNYRYIAKTDITNFYSSIYTHSIGWALHGREEAFADKEFSLLGNKIDRLVQYSNDARTNGISVGSGLSDLIAEIILAGVDRNISVNLTDKDFVAVRFKDDYRILCQSESDAKAVLRAISKELAKYNLSFNENKTSIRQLPDGLYRKHDREYFPHSLREKDTVSFKVFEHTLLIALDIHRENPGTSILEKFISEIFDRDKNLKIEFSTFHHKKEQQIRKMISLLFLVKRESEKLLCHVLSVAEQLYVPNRKIFPELKGYLKQTITNELRRASDKGSAFEVVWLIFFSRYIGLGITDFGSLVDNKIINGNEFYKSVLTSQQHIFKESGIGLFRKPSQCKGTSLAEYLAVFG